MSVVDVVLGLAGEADDDVAPHTGGRVEGPDRVEQPEEAVGVAEALHPSQHRRRGVLEGQVEVRRDARGGRDRPDQVGTRLGRLQVGDPHPFDAVDAGQLGEQRLQQPQVTEVLAVGRGVLADQEQLADPLLGQPAGLPQHVGGTARDERAPERRDGAEGAPPVAAAGQLERSHRTGVQTAADRARAGGGRQAGRQVGGGHRVSGYDDVDGRSAPLGRCDRQQVASVLGRVGGMGLAGHDAAQPRGDVGVVVEAQDGVGLRQRLGQVLAVALGEAAHRDDRLRAAGLLEVGGRQQGVDGVLLGRLDEAAGVDHDGVGVVRVVDQLEAAGVQPAGELLGVDLVAGAAQGHQGDGHGGGGAGVVTAAKGSRCRRRSRGVAASCLLAHAPDLGRLALVLGHVRGVHVLHRPLSVLRGLHRAGVGEPVVLGAAVRGVWPGRRPWAPRRPRPRAGGGSGRSSDGPRPRDLAVRGEEVAVPGRDRVVARGRRGGGVVTRRSLVRSPRRPSCASSPPPRSTRPWVVATLRGPRRGQAATTARRPPTATDPPVAATGKGESGSSASIGTGTPVGAAAAVVAPSSSARSSSLPTLPRLPARADGCRHGDVLPDLAGLAPLAPEHHGRSSEEEGAEQQRPH